MEKITLSFKIVIDYDKHKTTANEVINGRKSNCPLFVGTDNRVSIAQACRSLAYTLLVKANHFQYNDEIYHPTDFNEQFNLMMRENNMTDIIKPWE